MGSASGKKETPEPAAPDVAEKDGLAGDLDTTTANR